MKILMLTLLLLIAGRWSLYAQSPADSIRKAHLSTKVPEIEFGVASYYHPKFNGRPTASGELYDQDKLTAAHNRLPLGTMIRVTSIRTKKSVVVKVNDRLHHRNTRLVDLSRAAAATLGFLSRGLARVKVEVLKER